MLKRLAMLTLSYKLWVLGSSNLYLMGLNALSLILCSKTLICNTEINVRIMIMYRVHLTVLCLMITQITEFLHYLSHHFRTSWAWSASIKLATMPSTRRYRNFFINFCCHDNFRRVLFYLSWHGPITHNIKTIGLASWAYKLGHHNVWWSVITVLNFLLEFQCNALISWTCVCKQR